MQAAARLGYQPVRPRRGAGRLRRRVAIGFVCDEISTDPWTAIGSTACARRRGSAASPVIVMATRGDADMEAAALAQIGGAAARRPHLRHHQHPARRCRRPGLRGAPLVLLNCHVADGALPSVVPGEVAGGHAATDLSDPRRPRRIGYINGEASMEAARHRLRGYRQALATADLPFDPELVRDGNWQPLSGYEAHAGADGAGLAADRDLLRQRPDGGRLLRGAARARAARFPTTSR